MLGSLGVIIAAVIIHFTNWTIVRSFVGGARGVRPISAVANDPRHLVFRRQRRWRSGRTTDHGQRETDSVMPHPGLRSQRNTFCSSR
jgi:hypothetical protein